MNHFLRRNLNKPAAAALFLTVLLLPVSSNIGLVVALSTLDRKCVKQKSERIFVAFTSKGRKAGLIPAGTVSQIKQLLLFKEQFSFLNTPFYR